MVRLRKKKIDNKRQGLKDYLANAATLNKWCCFRSISTNRRYIITRISYIDQIFTCIFRSFLKGYSLRYWRSVHRNCKEDRVHYFQCGYGPITYHQGDCHWSGHYVHDFDLEVNYKCPNNGFLTGVTSVYSSQHRDRR